MTEGAGCVAQAALGGHKRSLDLVESADDRVVGVHRAALGDLSNSASRVADNGGDRRQLGGIGVHAVSLPETQTDGEEQPGSVFGCCAALTFVP